MDSLSQLVLGAAVGEAVLGKKIGNRALIWGGIAGTIPDLDVFTRPFLDIVEEVEFHRSISHSIIFFLLFAPLMAYLVHRWSKFKSETTFIQWFWLFFLGFFTHALLDCFTTWGTQILWPLPIRVAWNSIFVVDPIYTLPYLFILIRLAFYAKDNVKRSQWNWYGIAITSSYLLLTLVLKNKVDAQIEQFAKEDQLEVLNADSRPCPFQTVLWTSNVETKDAFYIYHYSFLDSKRQDYVKVMKNHDLLEPYTKDERIAKLLHISNHFYTIEKSEKGIYFNDLRFGQYNSWEANPTSKFVFSYHIYLEGDKVIIDEVEKEFDSAKLPFASLWNRIKGI
jgi:inner membrane protein